MLQSKLDPGRTVVTEAKKEVRCVPFKNSLESADRLLGSTGVGAGG